MANRNWASGGKLYSMHVKPVLVDCNFVVAQSNGNGITNLKGPCVSAVYMNSSAPSAGHPNPPAGYIYVKLADNYNLMFGAIDGAIAAPNSGTSLTSTTSGTVYVITSVGTTTAAQFQAKGLPVGVTPAVGVAFVASASGALGGTGTIEEPAANGAGLVSGVEVVGDPNTTLANSAQPSNGGGYLILRCMGATSAGVTTRIAKQPVDGSKINLNLYLSDSSILIQGE